MGNAGIGKTYLVRRFTQGMFPPGQGATIDVDFMIKTVEIEGEKIKVSQKYFISWAWYLKNRLKVALVGNAGLGKTSLVRRFTQGMFPPGQGATIGVDCTIKTVEIEGEKIKVNQKYFI